MGTGRSSERMLAEIKERVDMVEVLKLCGVELNSHGFCKCPFHNEKTASFGVYDNNKRYKCFGCGESGDVVSYTMRYNGINFNQALFHLSNVFGISDGKFEDLEYYSKRKQENERIKAEKEAVMNKYREALQEHCKLWRQKIHNAPKHISEEWSPLFIGALNKIDIINYKIEIYERKLKQ